MRLPAVCKKSIYDDFKSLHGSLGCETSYFDCKQQAGPYQEAKIALYQHLAALGYGDWVKKPMEVDFFV
jgi:Adenosine-deaminase (editase) domain